jgi:hypothetical protein
VTNDRPSWLPPRLFAGFFSNTCSRREPRVSFEWAPTTEKRVWAHLIGIFGLFAGGVVAMSAADRDPIHPLYALVLPFIAGMVWLVTNITRVDVHVSDTTVSIERFNGEGANYAIEQIDQVGLDQAQNVTMRMQWGERVVVRLPMPVDARRAVVDEVRTRIARRTTETYRMRAEEPSMMRIDAREDASDPVSSLEQPARQA